MKKKYMWLLEEKSPSAAGGWVAYRLTEQRAPSGTPTLESEGRQMFTQDELTQVRGTTQDFWGRGCLGLQTCAPSCENSGKSLARPQFPHF